MTNARYIKVTLVIALAVASFAVASPASAITEWETDDGETSAELTGFLRTAATFTNNPSSPELLYPNDHDTQSLLIGRLLLDARHGEHWGMSANVFQVLSGTTATPLLQVPTIEQGRSDVLSWRWADDPAANAELAVDQLFVRGSWERFDLRLGRQPIGLAATYYFTPNDFFSPFSASTFFRTYKPGVDAAVVDIAIGELSQLQVFGVLQYEPDDDGFDSVVVEDTSSVARASTVVGEFEIALVGGRLPGSFVIGGDLQGEVVEAIGLRAEGHVAVPRGEFDGDPRVEAALVLEHRFENTLHLRGEYFWHGAGFTDSDDYVTALTRSETRGYLGRHYGAIGASYELGPLLVGDLFVLANAVDLSTLLGVNLLYSVSDESSLAMSVLAPMGDRSELTSIGSEFGLYPATVSADFRLYF